MSELEKAIRKIVREEIERVSPQRDYRGFPAGPLLPATGSPTACQVCGLDFVGNGIWAYSCPQLNCPRGGRIS